MKAEQEIENFIWNNLDDSCKWEEARHIDNLPINVIAKLVLAWQKEAGLFTKEEVQALIREDREKAAKAIAEYNSDITLRDIIYNRTIV